MLEHLSPIALTCLFALGCASAPGEPPPTGPASVVQIEPIAPASSQPPPTRRPTYPETHCPEHTIADGSPGAQVCRCCAPFGIPCPDSRVEAPKPAPECIIAGSEDGSCLWKCP